ncbi:MAG: hypothetical protein A3I29_03795 [Candidatus Magasanikbacteria bacterium RIFCSPLOWO2_02_FULL_44_11]|uniref:Uncharacterized protein n=1 Tax=Candidatus Magasanikbacteria bacterium RIFCSPLOWO2_02_FULL_44_11 TaxID=1798689 RepID=A0A1F6NAX5_9BACT|nr:MAG: hypothetical protein A3I29_03795 [Candidatus Magasanikbacteria bacterium RIFCSPLOWO2_02_FULL_44_11]
MKKISVVLFVAILLIILGLALPAGYSLHYAFRVNKVIRGEVGQLLSKEPPLAQDIYQLDFKSGNTMKPDRPWNDGLVKVHVEQGGSPQFGYRIPQTVTQILTSDDDSKTWSAIAEFSGSQCIYSYLYGDSLYCIDPLESIKVINTSGQVATRSLFTTTGGSYVGLIAIVKKTDNELYYIWSDDRSRILKIIPYILSHLLFVDLGDLYWGPPVVVAGNVNLDTMQTEEHIIQYGPDSGGFIYDGKIWGSLTISGDGTSQYPQSLQ